LLGGGAGQLGIQAIGAFSIMGWTIATSGLLFLLLKFTVGLRVSEEEELRGLDFFEHGIEAYPDFAPTAGQGILGSMPAGTAASVAPSIRTQTAPGAVGGGGR
jgi:Amt family ammonium transporter